MSEVAPDGSPVPVYLALPAGDEPTIIHDAIDHGADILELGSGVGRLTRVLIAYGHEVVAVDDDPGMLAHVTGAETVCADVYGLDLGRRFGAVVLASHFINSGTPADQARLMEVCARHVSDDGVVLVQRYAPTWASAPADTSGAHGPVGVSIKIHEHGPDGFTATAEYRLADRRWEQRFSAAHVDDEMLAGLAAGAGLVVDGWLDEAGTWARLRSVR